MSSESFFVTPLWQCLISSGSKVGQVICSRQDWMKIFSIPDAVALHDTVITGRGGAYMLKCPWEKKKKRKKKKKLQAQCVHVSS